MKRFSTAAVVGAALVMMASCGSRTGLFGISGDTGEIPDSSILPDSPSPPDARPDGPLPCKPGRFPFERAIAQLMFVIDRSGSMAFSLDGTQPVGGVLPPGVLSRWQVLRNGLATAIVPFDATIAMGAKFYPEVAPPGPGGPDACLTDLGVGLAPAAGNATQILDVFDTTDPRGGTPTSEAIRLAAQYLSTARGVARTMIVATDGAPNCNPDLDQQTCLCTVTLASGTDVCKEAPVGSNCLDDKGTISVVKTIFETQKIPVYVLGIGGAEQPAFLRVLDDMAVAGGRAKPTSPKHYSAQTEAEMTAALASISSSVAQCTFLTPSAPTDPSAITVEINGQRIARDTTHTNGWDWVDQAYGTLAFFGPACDAASTQMPDISGVIRCD